MTERASLSEQQNPEPIRCAWYFLPLPTPLGLPDGFSLAEREGLTALLSERPSSGLRISIRLRQRTRLISPLAADTLELTRVAHRTVDAGLPEEEDAELLAQLHQMSALLPSTLTIAEVAIPNTGEPQIDEGLDEAIGAVRFLQQCVAGATQRPLPLLTKELLPPTIPVAFGWLHGEQQPTYEALVPYMNTRSASLTTFGVLPELLDEDQMQRLSWVVSSWSRQHPLADFVDLRREALDQLDRMGNTRLGVVTLASAGEVFVTTLLLLMMWEERLDPIEAAVDFDVSVKHSTRVTRDIAPRLGGTWSTRDSEPVRKYFEDLVHLRHRVVHAGHPPTNDEANAARRALSGFEHFVGDRLAAQGVVTRYPRTAILYLGQHGLERRNAWTRRIREVAEDPAEPNWIDTFARWRHHFDRRLDVAPLEPGDDLSRCVVYADGPWDGGVVRWTVHDPSTCHATVIKDDPGQIVGRTQVETVISVIRAAGGRFLRVAVGPPSDHPGGFVPDHEIYDDLAISPGPIDQMARFPEVE